MVFHQVFYHYFIVKIQTHVITHTMVCLSRDKTAIGLPNISFSVLLFAKLF